MCSQVYFSVLRFALRALHTSAVAASPHWPISLLNDDCQNAKNHNFVWFNNCTVQRCRNQSSTILHSFVSMLSALKLSKHSSASNVNACSSDCQQCLATDGCGICLDPTGNPACLAASDQLSEQIDCLEWFEADVGICTSPGKLWATKLPSMNIIQVFNCRNLL